MKHGTEHIIFTYLGKKYQNRQVLVAGADGFIGYNLVRLLCQAGARVSIISRRSIPRASSMPLHQIFKGDLRDNTLVQQAIKDKEIVFDMAGSSGATYSNKEPFRHLEEECGAHLRLFSACAAAPLKPVVIFCSTRLVYGKPQYLPVNEKHPETPLSIYAVHKITLENYLEVFFATKKLPYCIMRLSNPYGPHQPAGTTTYGIINLFLRRAAKGEPLIIYGDGLQRRDYVHIDDVAIAFMQMAVSPEAYGQIVNFGGYDIHSLRQVVEIISEISGVKIETQPWPNDYLSIETGDYYTDMSKINRLLELPPQKPLKLGLNEVFLSYREET